MYQLHFNEEQGLLEITLSGFWTVETVTAFNEEMARTVARYAGRFPNFPILSDSRALSLMSAEASKAWIAGFTEASRQHPCRVAIVVASILSKMQAQRVVNLEEMRVFTDLAEARRWLTSD